jgi:hypothetical protein
MDIEKGVGTVAALEANRLVVNAEERADRLAVPLADVTKLEVHRGKKPNVVAGALIGGGVGAALGIALAAGCDGPDICESGGAYVIAVPAAAALGAGLGALIGWLIKVDRWVEVPVEQIRVGISPRTEYDATLLVALRL